ncbi:MAG: nucleoside phosphorylase [Saprospiraceae bacterium]|nr:nucleoside phosphorylase [Bacteroidia bacterium]NNF20577.1 nucleoside phosphorylase [Saprospiraceae bacterium]
MRIPESELIINPDNSIYHLNLKPGDLATRIITVGDPKRIQLIRPYLDEVIMVSENREFYSLTGLYKGEPLSIISTGIGSDNIDIVITEVDALFNIDFDTRLVKDEKVSVDFIRIGTSGGIREDVPVGTIILSEYCIGLESLLLYYESDHVREKALEAVVAEHAPEFPIPVYAIKAAPHLVNKFASLGKGGITLTAAGFYGPQSRQVRAPIKLNIYEAVKAINYNGLNVTNFEMETAGIYGLGNVLGHNALSINAIIANRLRGEFAEDPGKIVKELIDHALQLI